MENFRGFLKECSIKVEDIRTVYPRRLGLLGNAFSTGFPLMSFLSD